MIRRIFPLAAVVLMLISLTGCGLKISKGDDSVTENTSETAEQVSENTETNTEADAESDDNVTPIYDTSAILEAYRSDDASHLSEKDRAIYDAAISAIAEFYADSMSEVETVTAAHDWIVTNVTYDAGMLLAIPNKTDETENPYGALILHQGICMGYTTTFQLFMDMLGVQSQIVRGTASGDGNWEEHAWNLVCIDGEYYHVDTTWDDFVPDEIGRPAFHMYLLVSDNAMEQLHKWSRDDTPLATSEEFIYYKAHGLYAESRSECEKILKDAHANGQAYCEIMTPTTKEVGYKYTDYYWTNSFGNYFITIYWMN